MDIHKRPRSKTFVSMDSLWYEEERLSTFIDWPVPFISARDLAREGFYYLRTKDHCACAFCRGIIGAWEEGDTPRGEHKRHFPNCPFVQGKVTPNVPLTQGSILARVSREVAPDINSLPSSVGVDVCGTGKLEKLEEYCSEGRILTKLSNAEVSMSSLGFRQYCGPKRKEYLTVETRLNSFKHWPENVKQTPKELAEAGFYYCGLSDHVRCFHCGKGLRNWEPEDDPWEEHARWFPDCHFVLLKKGIEFVDKVRRENPPYIPLKSKQEQACNSGSSGRKHLNLNDEEMEKLMELEIMKHVLEMGFSANVIKKTLRKKLIESGQPFFSVEACIDAILLVMEEETKNTIHGCEDITSQVKKMAALDAGTDTDTGTSTLSSLSRNGDTLGTLSTSMPLQSVSETGDESSLPPLPINNAFAITSDSGSPTPLPNSSALTLTSDSGSLPPLPNISRTSPPLRASTPTSLIEQNSPLSMDLEPGVEFAESSNIVLNNQTVVVINRSVQESPSVDLPTEVVPLILEADDIMEEAAKLLGASSSPSQSSSQASSSQSSSSQEESPSSLEFTSSSSSSSSQVSSASSSSTSESLSVSSEEFSPISQSCDKTTSSKLEEKSTTEVVKTGHQTENLALELQRMRENMMCKVCMDKEMDVVFLPCTHMVTCSSCAVALAACPICRRDIQYAFKPIIS